jgi:acetylornithine deacetylase/succinyl-diaminopimelate desuccinylase-like protein
MTEGRLGAVLERIEADLPAATARLLDLLRIPSVSTDPAHAADCIRAADWLVAELAGMGFKAARHDTPGRPVVLAHAGSGAPHLLFYGHYDVQPADPFDLWSRPPFDPAVEDGPAGPVIRGRGASDDKGQLMTFLEAFRAWVAVHGTLPCRITVFLEGEEESGSPSLAPFMQAHAAALRADLALICDTDLFAGRVPAIVTMLRGLLAEEVTIRAARRDLHSGMYGGIAINPIRVLARILGGLHDAQGRVTLPGFYDGLRDPDPAVLAQWRGLGFDHAAFLGAVGLSTPAGEAGRLPLEQLWSRPTAEINGIFGGYTGAGFKTVLPAEARAKVSFRLVPGQDPQAIGAAFRAWVGAQLPPDCTAEFHGHGASPACAMDSRHPAFEAARAALGEEWGLPAAYVGCGGSIPVAGLFQSLLGMEALLTGFASDDDRIHAPDEKYDLRSFRKGIRSWARILDRIAA